MKKVINIIVIIIVFVALLSIGITYSYYEDIAYKQSKFAIANWVVKLNDTDVSEEETYEFTIEDIDWEEYQTSSGLMSSNGKLAPGMKGSFTIIIDPRNTKVAMDYEISYDMSLIDNPNIVITKVESDYQPLTKTDEGYYGTMDLKDVLNNKIITITTEISWLDTEDNNQNDSETGSTPDKVFEIPVKVTVSQLTD